MPTKVRTRSTIAASQKSRSGAITKTPTRRRKQAQATQAPSKQAQAKTAQIKPASTKQAAGKKDQKQEQHARDRKSTRLNSSHTVISYAVFCLKKKKKQHKERLDHLLQETGLRLTKPTLTNATHISQVATCSYSRARCHACGELTRD